MEKLKKELRACGSKKKAKILAGFFKTGKGQYGEGDVFIGVMVPVQRRIAKKYRDMTLADVTKLLHSREHEYRLTALFILVDQFACADELTKRKIYNLYLANTKWINNWDLVDLSAYKIVGDFLADKDKGILTKLAHSENLWERRIAVLSTFAYIKDAKHEQAFHIAEILLEDKHDLIHKAVGWMLREVGKRCGQNIERQFLDKHYKVMPRTMLRYSLEHFSGSTRARYMNRG